MSNRDFKVGDVLRVRQWDDMVKEFGVHNSIISCRFLFTLTMKRLCGEQFTVRTIDPDGVYHSEECIEGGWNISADMLEYGDKFEVNNTIRDYSSIDITKIMG